MNLTSTVFLLNHMWYWRFGKNKKEYSNLHWKNNFQFFVQLNDSQFHFVKMSKFIPKKFTTAKVECVCVCVCVCLTQFCDVAQVVINCKMISQIWLKTEYDSVNNFKAVFCIIGYLSHIGTWCSIWRCICLKVQNLLIRSLLKKPSFSQISQDLELSFSLSTDRHTIFAQKKMRRSWNYRARINYSIWLTIYIYRGLGFRV
jgi:hypothetical protein